MYMRSYLSSALNNIPSGACLLGLENIHPASAANPRLLRRDYC